jgi:hypothetical protein
VHQLGEGLGEAVAQGLGQDGVEVVVLGAELGGEFIDAVAGSDGKPAEIVDAARILWGDEVGEAVVELAGGLLVLLAEEWKVLRLFERDSSA